MKRRNCAAAVLMIAVLLMCMLGGSAAAEDFRLPRDTSVIEAEAFRGCVGLTGQLVLEPGLEIIGDYAFAGCTGLTGVPMIPETVTEIGAHAFDGCEGLSGTLFVSPDVALDETAFANCPNLTVTRQPGDKIAVVGDDPDPTGDDFNGMVWRAVHAFCEDNELEHAYFADLDEALTQGYDTVFAVGFLVSFDVAEAAEEYPDVRFICLDAGMDFDAGNVYAIDFRNDQAGYLAGYAAVKLGYRSLGFMGGMALDAVVQYGQGFVRGASAAAAELGALEQIGMRYTYTGDFGPSALKYRKACAWYEDGTQVIFSCGGNQWQSVLRAAQAKDGKMIGVDTDQHNEDPDRVITSAMKRMDYTAVDVLERLLAGEWDSLRGTSDTLGIESADPSANYVGLPASTFGEGFTAQDYAALVASLYAGENGGQQISYTVEDFPVSISWWEAEEDAAVLNGRFVSNEDMELCFWLPDDFQSIGVPPGTPEFLGVLEVYANADESAFISLSRSPSPGTLEETLANLEQYGNASNFEEMGINGLYAVRYDTLDNNGAPAVALLFPTDDDAVGRYIMFSPAASEDFAQVSGIVIASIQQEE